MLSPGCGFRVNYRLSSLLLGVPRAASSLLPRIAITSLIDTNSRLRRASSVPRKANNGTPSSTSLPLEECPEKQQPLDAFEVFPTLRRFRGIWPRDPSSTPIGGNRATTYDQRLNPLNIKSLHDDLGVIAYAGCSPSHVEGIGAILKRLVEAGGSPRFRTSPYSRRHRVSPFGRDEIEDTPVIGGTTEVS